jgi:hypothetical protein
MSGYFTMEVHVNQGVEVELDTDEVLGSMYEGDIINWVVNNVSTDDILSQLDDDEVRTSVIGNMDNTDILNGLPLNEIAEYLVKRRTGLSAVLRYVADKLDEQEFLHG